MTNVKHAMSSGQARSVKRRGDFLRKMFKEQCCSPQGMIDERYLRGLTNPIQQGTYTMKTGKNWQFHLGKIGNYLDAWNYSLTPCKKIVSFGVPEERVIADIQSEKFIRSYILKSNYLVTADNHNWLIFNSEEILQLLMNPEILEWRILKSGRVKGDIHSTWGKRSIFTIEYRAEEHKQSFVIGAHGGGAGERLHSFLKENTFSNAIPICYESWKKSLQD
jgi:hypothetical protein